MNRLTALPGSAWRGLRRNLDLAAAFLLPAMVYAALLADRGVYPLDPHGSKTVFSSDLNNQYAQFYSYLDQAVTGHGSLLFTWRSDLGMNFWPIVAYYLTSPFGLFTLFASDRRLPITIAAVTVLKIGTAGLCMQLLLRRYRRRADGTVPAGTTAVSVLLSTGYALAVWTVVYAYNIMWLDALFLLPLVLLGIERLLDTGRVAGLAVAFGLTFILNFYTGAMIAVFAVLYGLARYFGYREVFAWADFLWTSVRFAVAGAIGVALSLVFLWPAYTGGISQKIDMVTTDSVRPPVPALSVLIRFFGGTVDMAAHTPNLASATLVLLLAPVFFTVRSIRRAERIAFGCVLLFLLAATEIPQLYVLMHGGSMPNAFPYRFAFLIVALLVYLAFRAWLGIDSVRQVKFVAGLGAVWLVVLYIGAKNYTRVLSKNVERFDAVVLLLGTAVLVFALWLRVRDREAPLPGRLSWLPRRLLSGRVAAAGFAGVLALDVVGGAVLAGDKAIGYQAISWSNWYNKPSTSYGPALQTLIPASDDFFRAEGNDGNRNLRSTNDSLRYGNFAQTHFSSLSSAKLHQALSDLGFAHYPSYVWASHSGATLFTDALLGYRYLVTTSASDPAAEVDRLGATLVRTYNDTKPGGAPDVTKVWRIDDTLPVGFRLEGAALAAMSAPVPADDPFAAQEQAFQAPGAFESLCGTPVITGKNVTSQDTADGGMDVRAAGKDRTVKVTWRCSSPGPRQVYIYAPKAFFGYTTTVRLATPSTPQPAKTKFGLVDPAVRPYPGPWANGIQDLGPVPAGDFTVTLYTQDAGPGLQRIPLNPVRGLDPAVVAGRLAPLRAGGVTDVRWSDTGLSATTTGDRPATVFFSIADIPGWTVRVDGRPVTVTPLLGQLTGVPVPAGTHRITFGFTPPGLQLGAAGTFGGVVALAGVWWFQRRRAAARAAVAPAAPDQIPEDVLS